METQLSMRSVLGATPTDLMKPTVEGPSWKPWTVMCTVSSTLAWLGVIDNLGPLGAAKKKNKDILSLVEYFPQCINEM